MKLLWYHSMQIRTLTDITRELRASLYYTKAMTIPTKHRKEPTVD